MSTDTNLKQPAATATATQTKPSAPAAPVVPTKPASATPENKDESVVAAPKYKSEDFDGAPIVKLRIKKAGTMQYDTQYGLKLDSTEFVEMPLTPFFASRINQTIELGV